MLTREDIENARRVRPILPVRLLHGGLRRTGPTRGLNIQQLIRAFQQGLVAVDGDAIVPVIGGGVANTNPIFTLTPNVLGVGVTGANVKSDGTGTAIATDIFKGFTAGANGSFVTRVRWNITATTAATTSTATVGRVFVSNLTSGATTGGTNTWLIQEVTLPSVSADTTSAPTNPIEVPINFALPASWTILVTNHAAPAANSAWQALTIGGDY